MINLIFADGLNGYGSEQIGTAANWREAAIIARRHLAKYGTVRRERNMPAGTDRLWVAPRDRAVHAEVV